jgi:hypothetical protein
MGAANSSNEITYSVQVCDLSLHFISVWCKSNNEALSLMENGTYSCSLGYKPLTYLELGVILVLFHPCIVVPPPSEIVYIL